ncbi:MAG TPA: c-type cytochrome [Sedimenticola sp.]|nr:c-type cytochrome [Sedimenticola sp.]
MPLLVLLLSACTEIRERVSDRDVGSEGARLYALHCSACHGDFGLGGVGVPLALPDFLDSISNRYIEVTIRTGRPGRVMPPFPRLSDEEVRAIVEYIRSFTHGREPEFPPEPVVGDPKRGERLYAGFCAKCHGASGEGGKGTGLSFSRPRDLSILAPALNNPGYLAAASDQMIKHTLMEGRRGTPMRSFLAKGLSERDIDDLVSYIRSFQHRTPADVAMLQRPVKAVLARRSPYSYERTLERVRRSIAAKGLGILREEFLGEGIVEPGTENARQRVIYFVDLVMLSDGLALDPRMGLFLPCRITVVEQDGVVKLMAANPQQYAALFNNSALNEFGRMLFRTYLSIFEEATLRHEKARCCS